MSPKIFFRADGNTHIGLGHLVRCSALAYMLQSYFEISFYCKEIPESFEKELVNNSYEVIRIDNEAQFIEQLDHNQIVVLDGYNFNTAYQLEIKAKGNKLVCIDDLHDKEFVADLIINHAPGVKPEDYSAQPHTQFALGLDYALLRPAFLQQALKPRKIEKIETALICFGGSDPKNLTQSTLEIEYGVIPHDGKNQIIVLTIPGEIFPSVIDHMVRSDRAHHLKIPCAAHACYLSPKRFSDLHRKCADATRCTIDQNLVT